MRSYRPIEARPRIRINNPNAKAFGHTIEHSIQVILAGRLAGVQGDILCKALEALSTVK